jgi:hypothetical protein
VLVYEYPVPPHLQLPPSSLTQVIEQGLLDLFVRMHILVIQSEYLGKTLSAIQANPGQYLMPLIPVRRPCITVHLGSFKDMPQ